MTATTTGAPRSLARALPRAPCLAQEGRGPSVRVKNGPGEMAKVRTQILKGLADLATAKYQVNDWMHADLTANKNEFSPGINELTCFHEQDQRL